MYRLASPVDSAGCSPIVPADGIISCYRHTDHSHRDKQFRAGHRRKNTLIDASKHRAARIDMAASSSTSCSCSPNPPLPAAFAADQPESDLTPEQAALDAKWAALLQPSAGDSNTPAATASVAAPPPPTFDYDRHVKFFAMHLKSVPQGYESLVRTTKTNTNSKVAATPDLMHTHHRSLSRIVVALVGHESNDATVLLSIRT